MALLKIFTVYDQKAESHYAPFFLPHEAMGIRSFKDCVNKEGHNFNEHPEDYTLSEVGTFDEETATLEPHAVAKQFGSGLEFLNPNKD